MQCSFMVKILKKAKMKYPNWYYKYYDNIFKRNNYFEEVSKVNRIYPIKNNNVLEIGSGKGYHAEEIIKLNPKTLILIDYQKEAFETLIKKFNNEPIIEPILADAFKIPLKNKADIALIFFSVLPQVHTINEFQNRIIHVFDNLINPNGILAFEFIDYDTSLNVFPENKKSLIFQKEGIEVYIKTSYLNENLVIEYFGNINTEPLNYTVKLLRLSNNIINAISKELKLEQVDNISLDKEGRRRIVFLKKASH